MTRREAGSVGRASVHAYQGLEGVVLSGCMGLIVGLIFLVSRRLWPIAFAHAAYNFLLGIL